MHRQLRADWPLNSRNMNSTKSSTKGTLRYWQDTLLPKYLETPSREEIHRMSERGEDGQMLVVSILATIGSLFILIATFIAMAWIINIIL